MMRAIFPDRWSIKPPPGAALDPGASLTQGLIAAYLLHEAGGSTAWDLVARRPAALTAPAWTAPANGPALAGVSLQFNGTSTAGQIANATALNPGFITIAAWVRCTSNAVNQWVVNKNFDGTSVCYGLLIGGNVAGVNGMVYFNGSWHGISSGVITDVRGDGQWHWVAGTYDGTNLLYYLDGSLNGSSTTGTGALPSNGQPLYIGEYAAGGEFFAGQMAALFMWNYPLPAAAIKQLALDPYAMIRPRRSLSGLLRPMDFFPHNPRVVAPGLGPPPY